MLAYFTAAEPSAIAMALGATLDTFGEDAREACRAWRVDYPEETERSVRVHLGRMGLPVAR
jgi:hypothetical protein